jgi:hypothetical protein
MWDKYIKIQKKTMLQCKKQDDLTKKMTGKSDKKMTEYNPNCDYIKSING